MVEDKLAQLLIERLVDHKKARTKMFGGTGPLGTFSAKIDLGLLVAFYDEQIWKMLHSLREVRNIFAHEMHPLDFTSERVVAKMRPLEFIDGYRAPLPPRSGRELFIGGCEFVIGSLYVQRDRVGRLSYPERPFAPLHGRASFDVD